MPTGGTRVGQVAPEELGCPNAENRMDLIVDYYYTSGILESKEDEVEIDLEEVAGYVCKRAKDEGFCSSFNPEEVFFIVQADLDFQEQNA